MQILSSFRTQQQKRAQIVCSQQLMVWLDHLQYSIHTQFDKNTKQLYKYKKRKKQINPHFRNAVQMMNRQQKVEFYLRCVNHLINLSKGIDQPPHDIGALKQLVVQGECQTRSFNIKKWKQKKIRLNRTLHQIMVQKYDKIKTYDLKDYILRKSKLQDMYLFVLEAINNNPHEKSRTVHIAFKDENTLQKWLQLVREQVYYCQWLNVRAMYYSKEKFDHSVVTQYKAQSKSISSSNAQTPRLYQSNLQPQNVNPNKSAVSQIVNSLNRSLLNSSLSTIQQKEDSPDQKKKFVQIQQQKLFFAEEQLDKQEQSLYGKRKTFIQHLVSDDGTNFDQLFDELENQTENQIQQKKNLNFFHKLMPEYQLSQLNQFGGYQTLVNEQNHNFQVLQLLSNPFKFKLKITFNQQTFAQQQLFALISEPQYTKTINDNISEINIKTMVKSQNSAILYQVLKAQNKFYRQRDFIFIRHAFKHQNSVYFVDKSIDNMNFPPFLTLVRGQYSAVWGIFKDQKQKKVNLISDLTIVNSGLLNNQQQLNLSLKYLNGFKLLFSHLSNQKQCSTLFDLNWNIDKLETNKKIQDIRLKRKHIQIQKDKITKSKEPQVKPQFSKKSSTYVDGTTSPEPQQRKKRQVQIQQHQQKQQSPTSAQSSPKKSTKTQSKQTSPVKKPQRNPKSPHPPHSSTNPTIKLQPIKSQQNSFTQLQIKRNFDKDGYVIIDNSYHKKKNLIAPLTKQSQSQKYWPKIKGHCIWKGDWIHDDKLGGIIFINQRKIQDQKGVLKFILTKIGKNILSGKSVLNISLPVDIFAPESNLQRLLLSMSYGPKVLQNLNGKSSLQKIINAVKFGVTNSVIYLNMQKPFNPILGQTFQCWINGCPGYGQQISHHPPIAALMFYGRGYTVSCQLQSKVELHMNSGCGTNQGIYKIKFDDGTEVCFISPGGQVSGLTYGDRKFNLVGKSYYWIEKEKIFMEVSFDAGKKGFFSKQEQPCDYFEGKLCQVTPQFFNTFPKNKKRDANDKEKLKELGRFEGIWDKYIKFNDKIIFELDKQDPFALEYEKQPLASDANWRQDIEYRRINQTIRAQTQKQRLEVVQRTDRKHRAKYGPNKH